MRCVLPISLAVLLGCAGPVSAQSNSSQSNNSQSNSQVPCQSPTGGQNAYAQAPNDDNYSFLICAGLGLGLTGVIAILLTHHHGSSGSGAPVSP
jgi:hypothetical protein